MPGQPNRALLIISPFNVNSEIFPELTLNYTVLRSLTFSYESPMPFANLLVKGFFVKKILKTR